MVTYFTLFIASISTAGFSSIMISPSAGLPLFVFFPIKSLLSALTFFAFLADTGVPPLCTLHFAAHSSPSASRCRPLPRLFWMPWVEYEVCESLYSQEARGTWRMASPLRLEPLPVTTKPLVGLALTLPVQVLCHLRREVY
jgi:hypothetical protein